MVTDVEDLANFTAAAPVLRILRPAQRGGVLAGPGGLPPPHKTNRNKGPVQATPE